MREILFRGKAINRKKGRVYRTSYNNGDWVYGLIERLYDKEFSSHPATMINEYGISDIDVDYTTLSQYTGLKDKNGRKIFEGDIVKENFEGEKISTWDFGIADTEDFFGFKIGKVAFSGTGTFVIASHGELWINGEKAEYKTTRRKRIAAYRCEVIGNIHDNPELLKEREK